MNRGSTVLAFVLAGIVPSDVGVLRVAGFESATCGDLPFELAVVRRAHVTLDR